MGLVRNNINVEGLSHEEELPDRIDGQLITYSETENLYIPEDKPAAKDIYEVSMEIDIKSKRTIITKLGKIIIIDGVKKFKILYAENNEASSATITCFEAPYNTFFEVPKGIADILDISVYILDAYFHLISGRKIYSHFIYQLFINYDQKSVAVPASIASKETKKDDSLLTQLKEIHTVLNEAALTGEMHDEEESTRIVYKPYDEVFR